MSHSKLGAIGVDIGTHTVKLAQAMRTPRGVRLHRASVIPRPTTWNTSDTLATAQPLSSAAEIRAALSAGGFSGRDAACTLPMNVCQLRGLSIPPGSDDERRTMIADELADEWSGTRDAMAFDFWELESGAPDKGADRNTVEVLAATRLWVSQLVRDCRSAGLDCWALDGTPLAMARAVGLMADADSRQRTLAIDWGYGSATMCVVSDERPLYARRLHDCGFGMVLDAIGRELGVTRDEAQFLADTEGVLSELAGDHEDRQVQRAITDAAAPVIETLSREVSRTLQFLETQRRHLQPTAVWLFGGGATLRHIGARLEQLIRFPVKTWSLAVDGQAMPYAMGTRSALFAGAMALSALAWRAA